ncbi:hypothetical protein SAMN04489761_3410 [Tenacibaculum sp. MAR_2009_124]|uniref:hypothetical protein n=1 Tax=Tenacibaculum sp. MAR_2009_124 TaxID=1250059 RepID=UPI00089B740F|nr:hypothetical protein [Tenacibaculum sp. MAR_2009_124]SEC65456.1 hypothetical protein SAMN04489761_3410 [Tenacibaculum sp. MAR_2009_124]
MKYYLIIFLFILSTISGYTQVATIDVGTHTALTTLKGSVLTTNAKLSKMTAQNEVIIKKLADIITLLEKQNNISKDSKDILDEELTAKKTTPDYVFSSREIQDAIVLKDKIIRTFNSSKRIIEELEFLERKEIESFITFCARTLRKANSLFKESRKILQTKSIINPEERLKRIDQINIKLESLLDAFNQNTSELRSINHSRKSKNSLINLSKS